ncbi:hypothetical protein [Gordonia otitidis]|uniref:hypothetical protein n=1 Tax=Gordonia otitidis TaxID=249058 RepID=UPI002357CCF8|nr:hypothetical protein [Gordonia otitidis]
MIDDKKKDDEIPVDDDPTQAGPDAVGASNDSDVAGAHEDPTHQSEVHDEPVSSETTDSEPESESRSDEPDTFDRAYVEDLRKESAGYRTQVRELQQQLHRVKVEQTGKLADPSDLEFDPAHLDDPDALLAAIEALLADRPHLKARRFDPAGAAQGPKQGGGGQVNLADIMRQHL